MVSPSLRILFLVIRFLFEIQTILVINASDNIVVALRDKKNLTELLEMLNKHTIVLLLPWHQLTEKLVHENGVNIVVPIVKSTFFKGFEVAQPKIIIIDLV